MTAASDDGERVTVLVALGNAGRTEALDAIEPLARYFEFWLLRLQGVYPSITAGWNIVGSAEPTTVMVWTPAPGIRCG